MMRKYLQIGHFTLAVIALLLAGCSSAAPAPATQSLDAPVDLEIQVTATGKTPRQRTPTPEGYPFRATAQSTFTTAPNQAQPTEAEQAISSATPFLPSTPTPGPSETPFPTQITCEKPRRVVILAIDGLRPDAIWDKQAAPFLLSLSKSGAYTWLAQTVDPSITMPAYTSMLTGYDVPHHGITTNVFWRDYGPLYTPTIFNRARASGFVTMLVAGWEKMNLYTQDNAIDYDKVFTITSDEKVALAVDQMISQRDFNLMFVYFHQVDTAGHNYGWMSKEYLEAVKNADSAVQGVYESLQKYHFLEGTEIIFNSDHGGSNYDHGGWANPLNRTIPWIASGPCVKPGYQISRTVRIYDTAATALWLLRIPLDDIDGTPVTEAFEGLNH